MTTTGQTTTPAHAPSHLADEPSVAWPTWRLLGAIALVAVVAVTAWAVAAWLGPWGPGVFAAGATGVAIVAVVTAASMLALVPWKARPISSWMQWWMGGSLMRLIVVPAVTYLLYSAASLSAGALMLGVGLTYVLTLFAEAVVLAHHVGRTA